MSVAPAPFQFYIQNPDGSLTLCEGEPPAGYVDISSNYGAFPQATSMVATPMPMEYQFAASPAPVTTEAAPAAAPAKKKKTSKKKKSGCC
mmetsp:Transcript_50526/g.90696  ORF Transcript_50526/g.90696 Transcript_50526/m.90696 type:complete len:90 (-) Transcript_50526:219-488(-)